MPTGPRCDVVMTADGGCYVNGTRIERLVDINLSHNTGQQPVLTLEMNPTSVIYGDVPNATVDALHQGQQDGTESVDIHRAIARVRSRIARTGIHPAGPPTGPGTGP